MNGKQRIITALELKEPDCVPLYIHGINEVPIIGIGKHLTDGLPEAQDFRLMDDNDKLKLVDTLFMIHEAIEDGAAGGGLILCSSNSLHPGVNPENCMAMFKAARKHGRYKKGSSND